MIFLKYTRRYLELGLGLMSFGFGQHLLGRGVFSPWAEDAPISYTLGMLGSLLFLIGIFFIIKQLIWFMKGYNQNNRILKVLGLALLISLLSGLVIGGVGQFLYDHTPISYRDAKTAIWLVSTICQTLLKLVVLYSFSCFYRGSKVSWGDKRLWGVLGLATGILLMVGLIAVLSPAIGEYLLVIGDGIIMVGAVYYLTINNKKKMV